MQVTGTLVDSDTNAELAANEDVYVIDSLAKVDLAPVSASTKSAIKSKLANATKEEQGGAIYVRKSTEDALASQAAQIKAGTAAPTASAAGCSDYDKTYSKPFSHSKNFNYAQTDETGAFTGKVAVTGYANASATAAITLRISRADLWIIGCTPYWASAKSVSISGSANVVADVAANGSYKGAWHKSTTVTEPVVYDDWISIGGIPVQLKVSLPIEAGIDVNAKADARLNGHASANGNFSIKCTGSGCDGTKSASLVFNPSTDLQVGLNARAHVIPFAKASLKLSIYSGLATARVGVKAAFDSDFWGYYGNTCGDANQDGTPEYVTGATLDETLNVSLDATASLVGHDWSDSWSLFSSHLGFWDLLGHSTALDPLLTNDYASLRLHARMRPCYPYGTDTVNYQIDWMDNTALQSIQSPAATPFTATHSYFTPALQRHNVTVRALSDSRGRQLNGSTLGFVDPRPTMMSL